MCTFEMNEFFTLSWAHRFAFLIIFIFSTTEWARLMWVCVCQLQQTAKSKGKIVIVCILELIKEFFFIISWLVATLQFSLLLKCAFFEMCFFFMREFWDTGLCFCHIYWDSSFPNGCLINVKISTCIFCLCSNCSHKKRKKLEMLHCLQ